MRFLNKRTPNLVLLVSKFKTLIYIYKYKNDFKFQAYCK